MEQSKKAQQFRRKILTEAEVRSFVNAMKALLGPEFMATSDKYHISIEDNLRYVSVAALLEDARTAQGLTLKEAAKELGTPKYRLEIIEKGHLKELNPGLLTQYLDYLGLKTWFNKWKKANPDLSARLGLESKHSRKAAESAVSLPVLVKSLAEKKIDVFLKKRLPPWAAAEVRLSYKVRGASVTVYEHRAPWTEGDTEWTVMSVAQLRYDAKSGKWTLYCADRNSRWHEYTNVSPTKNIDVLLSEIDSDPTGIFWG